MNDVQDSVIAFTSNPKTDEERNFNSMVISLIDDYYTYYKVEKSISIKRSEIFDDYLITYVASMREMYVDIVILPYTLLYNDSEERMGWFDMKYLEGKISAIDAAIRDVEKKIREEERNFIKYSDPEYWKSEVLKSMKRLKKLQERLCHSIEKRNEVNREKNEARKSYEGAPR